MSVRMVGPDSWETPQLPPRFTRHADGRITVDEWRSPLTIAKELLREGHTRPSPEMRVEDDLVTFVVANGRAVYRIVRRDRYDVIAELVEGEMA